MKRIIINVDGVEAVSIMNYLIQKDIDFSVRSETLSIEKPQKTERTHFRGGEKTSVQEVVEFLENKPGNRAKIEEIQSYLSSKGFKTTTAGPAVSRLKLDNKAVRQGSFVELIKPE